MKNVIGVLALALLPAVAAAADKPDWAFPVTEKVVPPPRFEGGRVRPAPPGSTLSITRAKADEAIHEAEYAYLKDVATIFAFSDKDFERIAARHVKRADDPYLILKADLGMSDEELKRHYRRLVA